MLEMNHFFEPVSSTLSYLVVDQESKDAIVIDPVLDFDAKNLKGSFSSINQVVELIAEHKLVLRAILETHVHADHLSGAWTLAQKIPTAKVGISKCFQEVYPKLAPLVGLSPQGDALSAFDL